MDANLIYFFIFSIILAITPGPDLSLLSRNILSYNKKAGIFTMLGMLLSLILYSVVAAFGLSIFLVTNKIYFLLTKYLGAGYLIYIGSAFVYNLLFSFNHESHTIINQKIENMNNHFWQGFFTNILNPRILVLYFSIIPIFIPYDDADFLPIIRLGLINFIIETAWFGLYISLNSKLNSIFLSLKTKKITEGISGILMIIIGLKILLFIE